MLFATTRALVVFVARDIALRSANNRTASLPKGRETEYKKDDFASGTKNNIINSSFKKLEVTLFIDLIKAQKSSQTNLLIVFLCRHCQLG